MSKRLVKFRLYDDGDVLHESDFGEHDYQTMAGYRSDEPYVQYDVPEEILEYWLPPTLRHQSD